MNIGDKIIQYVSNQKRAKKEKQTGKYTVRVLYQIVEIMIIVVTRTLFRKSVGYPNLFNSA